MTHRPKTRTEQIPKPKKPSTKTPKLTKEVKGKPQIEEPHQPTGKEALQKTIPKLITLGNQTFAYSPFNKYFDDWLQNLRSVLFEFESDATVKIDEEYAQTRTRIIENAQRELANKTIHENELEKAANKLAENKIALNQIDTEYSSKIREIGLKRNTEIERLTREIRYLEKELSSIAQMRTSFFSPFSKRVKAQKQEEVTQKLNSAKNQLEISMQESTMEQEKLAAEHARKREELLENSKILEKSLEHAEVDPSLEIRANTCSSLADALNELIQKKNN